MPRHVEIYIRAEIPAGQDNLGHVAIVNTMAPVDTIVKMLGEAGLTNATASHRIVQTKPRAAPPAAPLAVAAE